MSDAPEKIRAYTLLAIYYKLKLEAENPGGPRWRQSPMKQAIKVMEADGFATRKGNKRAVLEDYTVYLEAMGVKRS